MLLGVQAPDATLLAYRIYTCFESSAATWDDLMIAAMERVRISRHCFHPMLAPHTEEAAKQISRTTTEAFRVFSASALRHERRRMAMAPM